MEQSSPDLTQNASLSGGLPEASLQSSFSETQESSTAFNISVRAQARVAALLKKEGKLNNCLRIRVDGGGCSGFQYVFGFDTEITPDDHLFQEGEARILIDETSLGFLQNAEIDFVEDLMGASFQVRNPNATSGCGCGNSFSVF